MKEDLAIYYQVVDASEQCMSALLIFGFNLIWISVTATMWSLTLTLTLNLLSDSYATI